MICEFDVCVCVCDRRAENKDSDVSLSEFMQEYLVPGGEDFDGGSGFQADACPPGSTNEYSNVAAGLIGLLAEKIAGESFDTLAIKRVFAPLG
jgi:CubicO group peptidase (beta-lactamase class C family)